MHISPRALVDIAFGLCGVALFAILGITTFSALSARAVDQQSSAVPLGYNLAWSDEFNGTTMDSSVWRPRGTGPRAWGFNDPNQAFLDGSGDLVIRTQQVGDEYHTAMYGTQATYELKYGYIEIRAKVAPILSLGSRFWLQSPTNNGAILDDPATQGGEIDVMQYYQVLDGTGRLAPASHWNGYGDAHQIRTYKYTMPAGAIPEWHTYGVLWTPTEYVFYQDGVEVWRTNEGVSQIPEYLIVNGTVKESAPTYFPTQSLPADMLVDYVRVYQAPAAALMTANPSVPAGTPTTLTWASNKDTCIGTNFATGGLTFGSVTVAPAITTTYTINCSDQEGTSTAQVIVSAIPLPACTMTITPRTADPGASATLVWHSQNATSATLNDAPVAPTTVASSTKIVILPTSPRIRTYTLDVVGEGGTAECLTQVTIRGGTIDPGTLGTTTVATPAFHGDIFGYDTIGVTLRKGSVVGAGDPAYQSGNVSVADNRWNVTASTLANGTYNVVLYGKPGLVPIANGIVIVSAKK